MVEHTAVEIHALLGSGVLPPPINNHRCPECSMRYVCLPDIVAEKQRVKKAARELFEVEEKYT